MSLAAAMSDMKVEYVDGVTEFQKKFLPPGGSDLGLKDAGFGAYRAHMNVIRM